MLPAFHRERIEAATGVMREEVDRALAELRPGEVVDLYDWTRAASRCASRCARCSASTPTARRRAG